MNLIRIIKQKTSKKQTENKTNGIKEMCKKSIQSGVCPHACEICAWNILQQDERRDMNAYDVRALLENLETARIYAGAEFEKLCNNNKHIDACVFQSIRDSVAQNIQLLQSYVICKAESEEQK